MNTVVCPSPIIAETLDHLQHAGKQAKECVVLWLARGAEPDMRVERVYRPMQHAAADIFRIPAQGMRQLMDTLAADGLMIAAQVHSHPREAFHSRADDEWAIIRHENALSLVLPDFALLTPQARFADHAKVFRLSAANRWTELQSKEVPQWLLFQ